MHPSNRPLLLHFPAEGKTVTEKQQFFHWHAHLECYWKYQICADKLKVLVVLIVLHNHHSNQTIYASKLKHVNMM